MDEGEDGDGDGDGNEDEDGDGEEKGETASSHQLISEQFEPGVFVKSEGRRSVYHEYVTFMPKSLLDFGLQLTSK
ncbi:hypothetical protein GX50_04416 [[Emmonsia] crescens]|uniref:Uncharacterized protein n=1 Tax=[Emmonsia] crescens TaxID=73230 RepID=A0A2B7ZIC8_9EURO|nr:hypothetical protein GX50_04416 [Emmonsia crescens]